LMRGQRAWHVSNINVASRALHVGVDAVSADKLVAADVNSDTEILVLRCVFSRGKQTTAFHRGAHVVTESTVCNIACLLPRLVSRPPAQF